jgi:hypothetical protein
LPRAITSGLPPTDFQARTGLFTPPGILLMARRKISAERDMDRELGCLHLGCSAVNLNAEAKIFFLAVVFFVAMKFEKDY